MFGNDMHQDQQCLLSSQPWERTPAGGSGILIIVFE